MTMRTLMLRYRDKASRFVSKELCGIKKDGSPQRLITFLQKEGVMQGTPKDVQKMWDDLWSCGMWIGENSNVVLYLDKWKG